MKKLIRDGIPNHIEDKRRVTQCSSREEMHVYLLKKLIEECTEVCQASEDTFLEEMADVYEVLLALAYSNNLSIFEVHLAAEQKRMQKGGFAEGWLLELPNTK